MRNVEKPNLENVWEVFVKLGLPQNVTIPQVFNTIRSKLSPMLQGLKKDQTIKWYCFLIHGSRKTGDPNLFFHIRLEPKDEINDKAQINNILPDYCEKEMTALFMDVEGNSQEINGIDKNLLKNGEIEEAWRILGEQSEWLMNMLNIYKDNVEIPIGQITQFMHFYLNMFGLGGHAVLYLGPVFPF